MCYSGFLEYSGKVTYVCNIRSILLHHITSTACQTILTHFISRPQTIPSLIIRFDSNTFLPREPTIPSYQEFVRIQKVQNQRKIQLIFSSFVEDLMITSSDEILDVIFVQYYNQFIKLVLYEGFYEELYQKLYSYMRNYMRGSMDQCKLKQI